MLSKIYEESEKTKVTINGTKIKKFRSDFLEDPETFWANEANNLIWFKKWNKVFQWDPDKVDLKWFDGGQLNVSYNCLDRHL
ncbi:MAG: acetyl-coenzyme A synthetase, partial [Nitrosopumilales archaeon]